MKKESVAIIGAGRLGGALAIALAEKSYRVKQIIVRDSARIPSIGQLSQTETEVLTADQIEKLAANIVFITTQDAEIQNAAEHLAASLQTLPYVFHTSGALSSEILASLAQKGCPTASLHPAIAVSDAQTGAALFAGAYFCLEGDEKAVALGSQIVRDLQGHPFTIDTRHKSLYHAAAVMASGHVVSVFAAAVELLTKGGLSEPEARKIFLPLIQSAVGNLARKTPAEALTGTFARADIETMERHLQSFRQSEAVDLAEIYAVIGLYAVKLARRSIADSSTLDQMQRVLLSERKNTPT